jgi:hypothetical protein
MARRRIKNIRVGRCAVSIYKDSEWNEFVVVTKSPHKRFSGSYHTTNMRDARGTAAHQIKVLRNARGWCR